MAKKCWCPKHGNRNWDNDCLQFPRLIAELNQAGAFNKKVMRALCESMELQPGDIDELINRAEKKWDNIKALTPSVDADPPRKRLEYLRGELRAERLSYGELAELQDLASHIAPGDVELLEAAGVPEGA